MENFYTDDYKRVWGNKKINGEIEIIAGQNDTLNIVSDGNSYTLTLPAKKYETEYTRSQSELVDELNNQISLSTLPFQALLGGYHKDQKYNVVVLRNINDQDITSITGTFFDHLFS
ncbi:MAG: hypothetical protein ACQEXX_02015 [Bacillota bacterium]